MFLVTRQCQDKLDQNDRIKICWPRFYYAMKITPRVA